MENYAFEDHLQHKDLTNQINSLESALDFYQDATNSVLIENDNGERALAFLSSEADDKIFTVDELQKFSTAEIWSIQEQTR